MGFRTQASVCISVLICSCPLALGVISRKVVTQGDLAFIHIPYNFGHTIETAAFFRLYQGAGDIWGYINNLGGNGDTSHPQTWERVGEIMRPDGVAWGHLNPDLQVKSEITGCSMYFTPQKYWPEHLIQKYIGDKTTFGVLRDPAERLVAMFRGNFPGYGGSNEEYYDKCDVDGAVKSMALDLLENRNPFGSACTRIPQADYFDGPNGIKVVVDNRAIPHNINAILETHGYIGEDWHIPIEKVWHVSGCNEVGVWNLTAETRGLVRKAFSRDYELLCKVFDYCDENENTCIVNVPEMCPSWVDKSKIRIHEVPFLRLKDLDLKNILN